MEYSSSYALQNYRKVNSVAKPSELRVKQEWETSNLRVIRAFEDANGSEAGFILVHVSMVANTGRLVTAIAKILTALEARDRDGFNAGMKDLYLAYQDINKTMDTM